MSTFECPCGELISDIRVPNVHVGELVWDVDAESIAGPEAILEEFVDHILRGTREEWIRRFYKSADSIALSNADVIQDIIRWNTPYRLVYRCVSCNRLFLQVDDQHWACYKPEADIVQDNEQG